MKRYAMFSSTKFYNGHPFFPKAGGRGGNKTKKLMEGHRMKIWQKYFFHEIR